MGPLYKAERNIAFKTWTTDNRINLTLTEEVSEKISGTAYIITPSGKVDKVLFSKDRIGSKGSLNTSKNASISYVMSEP